MRLLSSYRISISRAKTASSSPIHLLPSFVLVLVTIGVLLSLVPEFFYLRDNFGTRINTIFKFYYQTWLVFSIASAYAVYTILADSRLKRRGPVFQTAFATIT